MHPELDVNVGMEGEYEDRYGVRKEPCMRVVKGNGNEKRGKRSGWGGCGLDKRPCPWVCVNGVRESMKGEKKTNVG